MKKLIIITLIILAIGIGVYLFVKHKKKNQADSGERKKGDRITPMSKAKTMLRVAAV